MELFSEIYNCYFQVLKSILTTSEYTQTCELQNHIRELGYEESTLFILPKLMNGEWNLFRKKGNLLLSKINSDFYVPLSNLQAAFLKSILLDEKIQLFFKKTELSCLQEILGDVTPLWTPDNFYYYDRFAEKNDNTNPDYQKNFRIILSAIKKNQYLDIAFESGKGNRIHHHYLPCRLEYSIKNDKFRLITLKQNQQKMEMQIINLERIKQILLLDQYEAERPDINQFIRQSYYKEPVTILIKNKRNALERTMLHFANYEKNTTKIDENTYQCLIYYNQNMETELLIEILSFGPMIQVLGNKNFLQQVKIRLSKQKALFPISHHC